MKLPQMIQKEKLDQEKEKNVEEPDEDKVLAWIEEMEKWPLAQQQDSIKISEAQQLEALQEIEQVKQQQELLGKKKVSKQKNKSKNKEKYHGQDWGGQTRPELAPQGQEPKQALQERQQKNGKTRETLSQAELEKEQDWLKWYEIKHWNKQVWGQESLQEQK